MTAGLLDGLLADRYRLDARIAGGGMGEVWRGEDVVLGRPVAVKTLRAELVEDEDFRARFRAEARHAGRLAHPGIASVYDFGELPDRAWLVMELVDGEPLSSVLRAGPLDPDRALDVLAQTAAALHAAHLAGVVHRDVKPGNLLVRPDGTVKVTDFGIASAADAVPLTRTGEVVGTAHYLSPEQATGAPATPASDLYALGVVLYEALAGARPFPAATPVAVVLAHLQTPPPPLPDTVPEPVRALVAELLAKDPADRPASGADVARRATALRRALAEGTAAVPVRAPVRPPVDAVIDQGRTQALPVAAPLSAGPSASAAPTSRRGQRLATRAVFVVLALLAAVLGVRSSLAPAPAAAVVAVPAVAPGSPAATARAVLTAAGLAVTESRAPHRTVAAGRVVALRPGSGTEVAPGSAVALVVSSGPPPVPVLASALLGRPAGAAADALTARGLVPSLKYDGADTPVGTVSGVEPVGDVAAGTTVVLHVVPAPAPPAPAPPAAAPVAEAEERGGKGGGKGKGKGRK